MFIALASSILWTTALADKIPVHVPGWTDSELYTRAIISNNVVYVSGVTGKNVTTGLLCPGGIKEETKCAFDTIATILDAAGTSLENVLDVTVFMGNFDDYAELNEVYPSIWEGDDPTSPIGIWCKWTRSWCCRGV